MAIEEQQLPDISEELSQLVKGLTPERAKFALWYFDPDRTGNQRSYAKEHHIHNTTLSIWKSEGWFVEIGKRWQKLYDIPFINVVQTLYQKATDRDDMSQVQAARTLAELLDKYPDRKHKVDVTVNLALFLGQASPTNPTKEEELPAIAAPKP